LGDRGAEGSVAGLDGEPPQHREGLRRGDHLPRPGDCGGMEEGAGSSTHGGDGRWGRGTGDHQRMNSTRRQPRTELKPLDSGFRREGSGADQAGVWLPA